MKSLKAHFFTIITFTLLLITSCNIETYVGEIPDVVVELTCEEAIQNVIQATTDYTAVNPEDSNYTSLCNAYKKALEDQINSCGDSNNTIKQIIEQLGNCGAINTTDCETAKAATEASETVFNSATVENYSTLCNAYKVALQNQINSCGDDNGVLQAKIVELSDCSYTPNDCEEAITLTAVAKTAFDNTSTEDYPNLCNAYKAALQQQISLCNDDDGVLQTLIDDLEDCTQNNVEPAPRRALMTANIAGEQFNNLKPYFYPTSYASIVAWYSSSGVDDAYLHLQGNSAYTSNPIPPTAKQITIIIPERSWNEETHYLSPYRTTEEDIEGVTPYIKYIHGVDSVYTELLPGSITITKFSLVERIIQGTFEFEYNETDYDTGLVEGPFVINGTFDYSLDDEYFD